MAHACVIAPYPGRAGLGQTPLSSCRPLSYERCYAVRNPPVQTRNREMSLTAASLGRRLQVDCLAGPRGRPPCEWLVTSLRFRGSWWYDPPDARGVTDGRAGMAGRTLRGAADPFARGRVPDAWLAERSRRRGPRGLAAAESFERERDREPGRLAH